MFVGNFIKDVRSGRNIHVSVTMFDFVGETSAAYHALTEKVVKVHLSSRPFSSTHTRRLVREWISLPVQCSRRLETAFYKIYHIHLYEIIRLLFHNCNIVNSLLQQYYKRSTSLNVGHPVYYQ